MKGGTPRDGRARTLTLILFLDVPRENAYCVIKAPKSALNFRICPFALSGSVREMLLHVLP